LNAYPPWTTEHFLHSVIKGQIAKELVKALLETSDNYEVYAFGYESSMSGLRKHIKDGKGMIQLTASNNRVRSMPDILVYDTKEHKTLFVEVKYRAAPSAKRVILNERELRWAKEFWGDSIWVVVIPKEHHFYVRKACEISAKRSSYYDLTEEFRPIEEEFPSIKKDKISSIWEVGRRFFPLKFPVQKRTKFTLRENPADGPYNTPGVSLIRLFADMST
jgi:Holliday junction resolvase